MKEKCKKSRFCYFNVAKTPTLEWNYDFGGLQSNEITE